MKMFVQYRGGKEPGLELLSSREDLKVFAEELTAAVRKSEEEGRDDGPVHVKGLDVRGDTLEWLSFRLVKDVDSMFVRADSLAKRRTYFHVPVFLALGLVVLYLAYRGLHSMF